MTRDSHVAVYGVFHWLKSAVRSTFGVIVLELRHTHFALNPPFALVTNEQDKSTYFRDKMIALSPFPGLLLDSLIIQVALKSLSESGSLPEQ